MGIIIEQEKVAGIGGSTSATESTGTREKKGDGELLDDPSNTLG